MELVKKEDKKKSNSKSVIIDGLIHGEMKKHCIVTRKKIGGVIEDLLKLYLSNPKELQKQVDNLNGN